MKKKAQEQKFKLDAKYNKIDSLKQIRIDRCNTVRNNQ